VDYLDIFEKVKLGNYEDALERIREQMVRAGDRYQGRVPEGENEYVVRGDDLVRLLELDEGMADIIDEIKIVRQKLNGVIVQIVEEVKELKTAT
jgi:hypothetical protein